MWISSILFMMFIAFNVQWSNMWIKKTSCFQPLRLSVHDVFQFDAPPLWTNQSRKGFPEQLWNIPYLLKFSPSRPEENLSALGVTGYLMEGSNYESGTTLLNQSTEVIFDGSKYLVFISSLTLYIKQYIQNNQCDVL